jgi:hypothetical protein
MSSLKLPKFSKMQVKNFTVASTLTMFVGGVYLYTMKAVGGSDEMEAAIEQFEKEKTVKLQQDTAAQS